MSETTGIGERIRKVRRKRGWTAAYLGMHAGLSVSFLSDLECGKREPSAGSVMKICRVLAVSPNWLLGWKRYDTVLR